jgi:hypothetical protein
MCNESAWDYFQTFLRHRQPVEPPKAVRRCSHQEASGSNAVAKVHARGGACRPGGRARRETVKPPDALGRRLAWLN